VQEGIYFTTQNGAFSEAKFNAANKVFAQLSGLRDKYQVVTKDSYDLVWKTRQDMCYLPQTLRLIAQASTTVFDLAMDELQELVSKKEYLAAAALYNKLPWSNIWPEGFGTDQLRAETQQSSESFRSELIRQSLECSGLEITEEVIRILSACERPKDKEAFSVIDDLINGLENRVRAFELASYWSTCPYFVCWNNKTNIANLYEAEYAGRVGVISVERVAEIYLEVTK
jgi:hypothetical protein